MVVNGTATVESRPPTKRRQPEAAASGRKRLTLDANSAGRYGDLTQNRANRRIFMCRMGSGNNDSGGTRGGKQIGGDCRAGQTDFALKGQADGALRLAGCGTIAAGETHPNVWD
jgi:hypothetical protein